MFNLSDIQLQVLEYLGDPAGSYYSFEMLDLAILQALAGYSAFFPNIHAEEVTLTLDGRDQPLSLSGLSGSANGVINILDISYTSPTYEYAPTVPAHYLYSAGSSLAVHLSGSIVPAAGDTIAIRYTVSHTIAGLQGATYTTVRPFHHNVLVVGASAHASSMRAASISEAYGSPTSDSNRLLSIASGLFALFHDMLADIRSQSLNLAISFDDQGTPTPRWKLDRWDR